MDQQREKTQQSLMNLSFIKKVNNPISKPKKKYSMPFGKVYMMYVNS